MGVVLTQIVCTHSVLSVYLARNVCTEIMEKCGNCTLIGNSIGHNTLFALDHMTTRVRTPEEAGGWPSLQITCFDREQTLSTRQINCGTLV